MLWITAGVLLLHLWLLAGGGPVWPASPGTAAPPGLAPLPEPAGRQAMARNASAPATAVTISSVRWIVPAPQPQTDTTRPAPAVRPRPAQPAAAADADAPRPPPIPIANATPAPSDPSETTASPAPAETPASPTLSEAVPVDTPPIDTPPAQAPGDTLLAAAPHPGASSAPPQPALPPASPPGAADLLYEVSGHAKGLRYSAEAHLRWQPNGTRYSAELEISAFLVGRRVQTSSGHLNAQGLVPERFGDRRRGTEKATHFDHAGQRIRYSSNAPDTPLEPGAQDRLSVFLQLAALFQAQPDGYPAGQMLRLQVAGTGDAQTWSFQVGPPETLALPAGSVTARRLTRPPRREFDSTVDIWLAPALQHLPVRIRITEHNGDMADQQLRQLPP
ncbi:MAG: DUF3108 domain-containing protein [Comamonadaceae bacterium]|nr:DUF3108 domain-containing protein [Comamonadaceae bacterium]